MHLSPDQIIFFQKGFFKINLTLLCTWLLMFVLVLGSKIITSRLRFSAPFSRWQMILEAILLSMKNQLEDVGLKNSLRFLPFIGTLFLFIGFANVCTIFPFYQTPTSSLSTTVAFALVVMFSVPYFGIREHGIINYLKSYLKPTPLMMPFHLISECSRTLSLAIRLFGNMMSGEMVLAIFLIITPLFFPIFMNFLGLVIGIVQAYIFSILTTVYIAAAVQGHEKG